ncbi:unnamed protein product [Alternaria alternata]
MSDDSERVSVHGRVFQRISLDEKIYFAPVAIDDREESRLTAQHRLVARIFGDSLFSSRVSVENPSAILECGYGNGEWAVQCAEDFEDCEMIGDLLESLGLWPFTSTLGRTAAEFDSLMEEVRTELQDVNLKLYIEM